MNWTDFKTVASFIGIPGAMMAVALWAIFRGYFVRKGEFDEMKSSRDMWIKMYFSVRPAAERLQETNEKLVDAHAAMIAAVAKKE